MSEISRFSVIEYNRVMKKWNDIPFFHRSIIPYQQGSVVTNHDNARFKIDPQMVVFFPVAPVFNGYSFYVRQLLRGLQGDHR